MFPSAACLLSRLLAHGTLRHVQVLLMLAETGTIQGAAEAVGVSPSSLEQALSQLEDILETELFRRDGATFQPTAACSALLPHARQVMAQVAGTADALVAHHQREKTLVRVLAANAAASSLLAHALPAFKARYARVQVQWGEVDGGNPIPFIARGEVDLVACRRPAAIPEGWGFLELQPDAFAIVCAPDHSLASGTPANWDELARHAWLLPSAGSAARERFDALMAHTLNAPASYCVVTCMDEITDWLLRDREMLAFVPVSAVSHLLADGELVLLRPRDAAEEPLGLLQPRCCSEAALRLAGFLQHFAAMPARI